MPFVHDVFNVIPYKPLELLRFNDLSRKLSTAYVLQQILAMNDAQTNRLDNRITSF